MRFEMGALGIRVFGTNSRATAWIADELAFHRSGDIGDSAVTVELTADWNGPDWHHHARRLVARWHYRLEILDHHVSIAAVGNRLAVPLVFHMLVSPSLRLMAARRGVLMLHSGTVSEGGRSLIFAGPGGAGKTTTTSLLMAAGGQERGLQADDYTFVDRGSTRPFVTQSHLYGDLLRWVPEIGHRLTSTERARAIALQAARNWSRGALRWPVRLPQERLWGPRTVDVDAKPAALVVIRRGNVPRPTLDEADGASVVEPLLDMNFGEADWFIELTAKAYGHGRIKDLVSEWRTLERELLEDLVSQVPVWRLTLPATPSANGSSTFVGQLEELLVG